MEKRKTSRTEGGGMLVFAGKGNKRQPLETKKGSRKTKKKKKTTQQIGAKKKD